MTKRLDAEQLRGTLRIALEGAWNSFVQANPDQRVYGLGFYTAPLAEYVCLTIFTEEGLDEVAENYAARTGKPLAEERISLRWSPCDSPHHLWGEERFGAALRVLDDAPDPYGDGPEAEARVEDAFRAFVETLRAADRDGLFGPRRDHMVLSIWMGDQSNEERIDYAFQLNSKALVERFEEEVEAPYL